MFGQQFISWLKSKLGKYSGNRRTFSDKRRFCIALYFAIEYCVRHLSDCSLVSRIITCTLLVNPFCSFERDLAAEARRVNENEVQNALDLLTNPQRNCALQVLVSDSSGVDIEELVSMGYLHSELTILDCNYGYCAKVTCQGGCIRTSCWSKSRGQPACSNQPTER
ncbi:unnamed protein product [Musa textilis]